MTRKNCLWNSKFYLGTLSFMSVYILCQVMDTRNYACHVPTYMKISSLGLNTTQEHESDDAIVKVCILKHVNGRYNNILKYPPQTPSP